MDYDELKEAVFSVIKDDDPYKASKQLQMRYWCSAHLDLFDVGGERKLPFFLDVLSNEECWEKTGTIYGIKLNRRIAAKKMLEPQSWRGESNPLDDFDRYQVACWCCLEEDIVALFEHFKQEDEIKDGDTAALKKLVKSVSGSYYTDSLMEYWSHLVSGYTSELKLESQHLYAYGLDRALSMSRKRVEAVEFFWNKIKSLPEDELSTQHKDEIFMRTAVRAAGSDCNGYTEIFEFCFSQINPDKYPELLKRDLAENRYYGSLNTLQSALCFNQFQKLFDCLKPNDLSGKKYSCLLWSIKLESYSGPYIKAATDLFMHMWMREGFDNHRALVLKEEMTDSGLQGDLLVPLVKKDYMEPVWAVLDKASPNQIKEFMNSKQANHIRSILILKERGDDGSLDKFLSYGKSVDRELENLSTDLTDVKLSKAHSLGKR